MEKQGAKMADTIQNIVTSMQAAQTQQAQFIGEFMKPFAGTANQAQHKDWLIRICTIYGCNY